MTDTAKTPVAARVETNGINVIAESERKGSPQDLFWPWTAASISVLGISYGSFALGYGVSFWQALVAGLVGVIGSGILAGLIAIAGKRGSAPTLVLSRAAFGVNGNRVPSAFSWVLSVGWETVLTALAALAASTVFRELGWGGGNATLAVSLVVVVALIVLGGVLGFDAIMKIQTWITYVGVVLTVVYVVLVIDRVDWSAVSGLKSGGFAAVVGVVILMATATGLGWVNAAADYSRYLPRSSSGAGVAGWTATGLSVANVVLFGFGLLLAGSDPKLNAGIGGDPIGALASILPTWFLVPFVVVAVIGLVSGALLDIYSSGLSLLSLGLPASRPVAALVDGVIMVLGSVYVLFIAASDFVFQFEGFLITLGVPIAAWAGIMLADIALRKKDYDDAALSDPSGRYGSVRWASLTGFVAATFVGWGLVTNTAAGWLSWQGYLMWLVGGKTGPWQYGSLGVVVALLLGFVGYLVNERRNVAVSEQ
ncbi:MAG: allantoin permease [Nocardioidaceae bacterium]|nr:allantoin permease [Nocardioidaceae bacterium]